MAIYYITACHDCKTRVMWQKCTESTARMWHYTYHPGHNTELGSDLDDDFYSSVFDYADLGIKTGAESLKGAAE
ncbi:hypothetical protein DUT88_12900 [Shouchella clausii]|nr:hypothetical protein DUT88_12900 [Shouchella clausii]